MQVMTLQVGATQVHLLVRGSKMRASAAMQDRVKAHSKITIHLNTNVQDAYADAKDQFGGLLLADSESGEIPLPKPLLVCISGTS